MQLALPFAEALALATAAEPLPPMVRDVRCVGSTVHAQVDLTLIPEPSTALRFAAAVTGVVDATVTFAGFADGVAELHVTAVARGLPAHKLVAYLVGPINAALRARGLPDGLVEVRAGAMDPVVVVRVQDAVATKVAGVTVTGLGLRDAVIYAAADVGAVRLR